MWTGKRIIRTSASILCTFVAQDYKSRGHVASLFKNRKRYISRWTIKHDRRSKEMYQIKQLSECRYFKDVNEELILSD